jgi:drug efflux transport system permease protein
VSAGLMRLRGLMRKEIRHVLRDPSAILIAFLMPIVLLLTNGFGISLDASEMKLAVVIAAPEETARGMLQALDASPYLAVQRAPSTHDGEQAMIAGRARGMLVVRDDFSQRLSRVTRWPAAAQLVVHATDPNTARVLESYVSGALQVWLAGQLTEKHTLPNGLIDLQYRDWFNPELRSADFIVPGIIAMVMTMAGTLLTASGVSREWEQGTMESMLASPARMVELILARLLTNFGLGVGSMLLSVLIATVVFGMPFRGGFIALAAAVSLFLMFALGLGLFISTLSRSQFVAG